MAIDDRHPEYEKYAPQWSRIKTCIAGRDEVLEMGTAYLPQLGGQDANEYEAYANRAVFFNATGRTHEAYDGLIFSRPATVNADENDRLRDLFADVDLDGNDVEAFAQSVVDEVLKTRRAFVLVDHNLTDDTPIVGDEARPYLRMFPAEDVINWSERVVAGRRELGRVIISECVDEQDPSDEFSSELVPQLRVLDMDETNAYRVRIYREIETAPATSMKPAETEWQQIGEDVYPQINGEPWRFIPGMFIGSKRCAECRKSLLLDIADLNLAHWRSSADYEHGAHFTGLPTPYVTGYEADPNTALTIGSANFLTFENEATKIGFLEFTGTGLSVLESSMTKKEAQMAALGARMLAPEKTAVESGEALSIRRGGDLASLSNVSVAVSSGLTACLQWFAQWSTLNANETIDPANVSITLNNQFVDEKLTAQEITALNAAYLSSSISHDTLIYNLQRGGRLEDGRTIEDEKDAIADGTLPPTVGPPTE